MEGDNIKQHTTEKSWIYELNLGLTWSLWLHLDSFFWWRGLERRHDSQSIKSILPERGCQKNQQEDHGSIWLLLVPGEHKHSLSADCRSCSEDTNMSPALPVCQHYSCSSLSVQVLTKAHCWLVYRTNTHPQNTHPCSEHPVGDTPHNTLLV